MTSLGGAVGGVGCLTADWWERMEAVGWLRDAHRSSSQVVEIKRAMDSAAMFRRLQEILLDELGPLLVPAEQR